jgi:hypothetical protein
LASCLTKHRAVFLPAHKINACINPSRLPNVYFGQIDLQLQLRTSLGITLSKLSDLLPLLDRRPIGLALLKKPRDKLGIPVLYKSSRKRKLRAKENPGQKLIKLVTTPSLYPRSNINQDRHQSSTSTETVTATKHK